MRKLNKPVSILLSLILVFSVFTIIPVTASAEAGITYIVRSWNAETMEVVETTEMVFDYTVLTTGCAAQTDDVYWAANGWYVVNSDVTLKQFVSQGDNVNLLLCDGAKLTCSEGLTCDVSIGGDIYHLNIFSQQNGTGEIVATGADNNAGIGGLDETSAGVITIHGGKITANGDKYAAGIGGDNGHGGTITIYGGEITATGGTDGAGIGGGDCGDATVTINGGIVTATGGGQAAGIGGGCGKSLDNQGKGIVTINGGTVTAKGGWHSAGIGGSEYSDGIVNITGGKIVSESGGYAAAIGGGYVAKGEVTITGGDITANSGGIGSGWQLDDNDSAVGSVTLNYGENGVSVYSYEYHNTDITLSKAFTDGTNIYQAGSVTEDQIKNKTLTPYDGMGSRLAGHSVSLEGDIAVNFYMELSNDIVASQTAYMQFSVPNTSKEYQNQTVKVSEAEQKDGYYVFKCRVAAKDMNSKITAQLIDGDSKSIKYTYSVKEYADYLLDNADAEGTDIQQAYADAAPLVIAMLNYGAYAQLYFTPDTDPALLANVGRESDLGGVDGNSIGVYYSFVNDLSDPDIFVGATLSLKSETTVSLYFESESELTFECAGDVIPTVQSGKYQVARIRGIKAKELVKDFTVTVKEDGAEIGLIFYSPMTYCYNVLEQDQPEGLQNVCKALYLYAAAADDYFNEPAPAPVENVVDLGALTGDYEAQDGDVLTGVLGGDYKITIADDATITLKDATITCLTEDAEFAGITPLGDATILLVGTNTVKGGHEDYPGIFAAENATLTIDGEGSLDASSNGYGCGIGGGFYIGCGNIIINGGTVTATGGECATGIGGGEGAICGNITINGGTITANGGEDAAGIGSGYDGSCGNITINGGTVTAIGGKVAPGIGGGTDSDCGNITIAGTVTMVTATKGSNAPNSIGAGKFGTCGDVTIGGVEGAVSDSPYTYQPN